MQNLIISIILVNLLSLFHLFIILSKAISNGIFVKSETKSKLKSLSSDETLIKSSFSFNSYEFLMLYRLSDSKIQIQIQIVIKY